VAHHLRQFLWSLGAALVLSGAATGQEDNSQSPAPDVADGILEQVQAQMPEADAPRQPLPSAILVLNQERFVSQSLYGQRVQREVEAASEDLAAENREIEAALTQEELDLTELRATMDTDEFRALADEFDQRVEGIRAAQEAKQRALQTQADLAQARFFEIASPILVDIVRQRGAAVLMDSRAVLLSAGGVDITDIALARINEEVGEGGDAPLIDLSGAARSPEPRPTPDLDTAP